MYRDQEQRDFARTLRNEPTGAERRLLRLLRAGQLHGRKFRGQAAIGPSVVDFVCLSLKLIVELGGPQHLDQAAIEHDTRRDAWLSTRGFHILRFRNQSLDDDIQAVIDAIAGALDALEMTTRNPPTPALPAEGREPNQGNG